MCVQVEVGGWGAVQVTLLGALYQKKDHRSTYYQVAILSLVLVKECKCLVQVPWIFETLFRVSQ